MGGVYGGVCRRAAWLLRGKASSSWVKDTGRMVVSRSGCCLEIEN